MPCGSQTVDSGGGYICIFTPKPGRRRLPVRHDIAPLAVSSSSISPHQILTEASSRLTYSITVQAMAATMGFRWVAPRPETEWSLPAKPP